MNTPIADFLKSYAESETIRFHMPGHKGRGRLGCEKLDITEIQGADFLYESDGIIAESESIASKLFGTRKTCYSTEGSSQCIRAMLYLALTQRKEKTLPLIVAARNAHKSFIYAAAALDFDIKWIYPEKTDSLCRCDISVSQLEETLKSLPAPPAAVYITSVDYLGGIADIASFAEICHKHGTVLAVDNAHGAYLHFLENPVHPIDLGADVCCDSAHKTLPALTGGAYLHIGKNAPESFAENAKSAMELFGSTSPSYLIMASLDLCNEYIADGYKERLAGCAERVYSVKTTLAENGWSIEKSDPLRITLNAPRGSTGIKLAQMLREQGIECEYADRQFVVFMATAENSDTDFEKLISALGENKNGKAEEPKLTLAKAERVLSVREAMFKSKEKVLTENAIGQICASPTVSCPPAIPIAVSGEKIDENAVRLFEYYGIEKVEVINRG